MKFNSKVLVVFILISSMLMTNYLLASSPNLTTAQTDEILNYVQALTDLQNQIYTFSQNFICSSEFNTSTLDNFEDTGNSIEVALSKGLVKYKNDAYLYRDLLLLKNVINYMRCAICELKILADHISSSEKATTLERFYYFRLRARQTLNLFDPLLS
ncbi:hypothetical protein [Niameybacter massiliensis]|uniref:hypothetical protein n=1 Tax=Niameybacter massiliensis TaxID=1658108 RepID=UPI0006B682B3|nr:hypothetical protein [Niameybacter massiliensis]